VGVDQVDALAADQAAEPADPAQPLGPVQAVHGQAAGLQLGDQAVLPGQQVGEPVPELLGVQVGGAAGQQLLGAAAAKALDEDQDAAHAVPASSW
jgi:hypothetical protein